MQLAYDRHNQKSFYYILGKLLFTQRPEIAEELVQKTQQIIDSTPAERDLLKIKRFLFSFCTSQSISVAYFTFSKYQTDVVNMRRVFLGAILKLYVPWCFNDYVDLVSRKRDSFSLILSNAMDIDRGNLSKMIREVITMHKVYEDFRTQVESVVDQFKQTIDREQKC